MDETRPDDSALPPPAEPTSVKPDRALIKASRREGRAEGAQYLKEKKACSTAEETKAFKRKWKQQKKAFKSEFKNASPAEKTVQKKKLRAFKHRIHRRGRIIRIILALMMLICLVLSCGPRAVMLWRTARSQKYTNSGADVEIARAAGYALSAAICDEGFVLLKNEDGFLPLQEKKLNLFGNDAYAFANGDSKTGASTLFTALEEQGISCNGELLEFYAGNDEGKGFWAWLQSRLAFRKGSGDWRMPENKLIKDAKDYSSQALIVLTAESEDGGDVPLSLLQPMAEGTVRSELIDTVCREFEHVILVVNSGNVMELGFANDYDTIDAVIWTGLPGTQGCTELARILTGEVNPSGRCVDTWPVSVLSSPAYAGGESYYANHSGLRAVKYGEGIYVGYRYYETRYGEDEESYRNQVLYPFGSGLSYTDFTEELTDLTDEGSTLKALVTVKNIGDVSGKDVVQVYCMPPYSVDSGIEKSAITLAGFAKTGELAPGEEETLEIIIPLRNISSWSEEKGCWLLESGEYRITAGKDVHAALLTKQAEIYIVEEDLFYSADDRTGTELQNQFSYASVAQQALSRNDWEGTYPAAEKKLIASNALKQALSSYAHNPGPYADKDAEPVFGAGNGVSFSSLKGLAYEDEAWEAFLDQFTLKEMIRLTANGAYHTEPIKRLEVSGKQFLGGSAGLKPWKGSLDAVSYPAEVVAGSTWNTELASQFGQTIASEAKAYGIDGWYAPDAGLHRIPAGANNASCFSEDPLLAGSMAAETVRGAQEADILAIVQGFVCGDAEAAGRNTSITVSEQALREIWLKPFELAVKDGGAKGIAVSPSRLGVEWCGASSTLLNTVLRKEWGFDGIVTTEGGRGSWMNASLGVKNGSDLILDSGMRGSELVLWEAYYKDRIGTAWALRDCVHAICYTIVNGTE